MSKILFSPREDKIHILKPPCNFLFIIYILLDSMQKAVNDFIDIFTSEDMENVTGCFLVKHSHLYNKKTFFVSLVLPSVVEH